MVKFSWQYIVIVLIVGIASAVIGYSLGYQKYLGLKNYTDANTIKTSPLFQIQTAIIPEGKIIILENNILTVENDQNQKAGFPLSKKLTVYKPVKPGSSEATASSDIKAIETDRKAAIVLDFIDGQYQVSQISYPLK